MRIPTRAAVAVAIAVTGILAAGIAGAVAHPEIPCGEQVGPGTGPDTAVTYTPCPGSPVPPAPAPAPVTPRPGMTNVRAIPFTDAVVGADDRTVTVTFWSGVEPCYVLDHVDVAYASDAVTISLYQGSDPNGGAVACNDIAVQKSTVVTLEDPLAGRTIVDGAAS